MKSVLAKILTHRGDIGHAGLQELRNSGIVKPKEFLNGIRIALLPIMIKPALGSVQTPGQNSNCVCH
jgi:hypothetical protein